MPQAWAAAYYWILFVLAKEGNSLEVSERFSQVVSSRRGGLTVVLEDVRKENVALIARTADALGIGTLHCIYSPHMHAHLRGFGELTAASKSAQLSRVSRSATDWLRIENYESVDGCLRALKDEGFDTIIATEPKGERSIYEDRGHNEDWALAKTAICFGSEGHGLSAQLLDAADLHLVVPQRGMTQSLNVAACAAIVLGEITRRRDHAGLSDPLPDAAQRSLLADLLLPATPSSSIHGGRKQLRAPPRLHNKAHIKHQMRSHKAAFKAEIRNEEERAG